MKETKLIILVFCLFVILGLIGWWHKWSPVSQRVSMNMNTPMQPNPDNTMPGNTSQNPSKTQDQLYTAALKTYQNRIQFAQCHGLVSGGIGTLVIKEGVKFMLDNRDPKAHTIAFGGQSYRIGAYNFSIVSATKIGIYPVTCDGGGAATLNVQP
jgi:hypothetical protein